MLNGNNARIDDCCIAKTEIIFHYFFGEKRHLREYKEGVSSSSLAEADDPLLFS